MGAISATELADVHKSAERLYNEAEVETAIAQCAAQAAAVLEHQQPLVLPVMNGGLTFCDRLLVHWQFALELDYLHFSRYRGELHGAEIKTIAEPSTAVAGRHVVIVDDIFDQGLTLARCVDWAKEKGAAKVTTVILADKQHQRRETAMRPDFSALKVPDRYVYGYGMDYRGWFRNQRAIYALGQQKA